MKWKEMRNDNITNIDKLIEELKGDIWICIEGVWLKLV